MQKLNLAPKCLGCLYLKKAVCRYENSTAYRKRPTSSAVTNCEYWATEDDPKEPEPAPGERLPWRKKKYTDHQLAWQKEYYQKNKEKILARNKEKRRERKNEAKL